MEYYHKDPFFLKKNQQTAAEGTNKCMVSFVLGEEVKGCDEWIDVS